MKTNRKKILILSLTLLFVMACRTYACGNYSSDGVTSDGKLFDCERFYQTPNEGNIQGTTCFIECPGMSDFHPFDIYTSPNFSSLTYAQVQGQYCPASSSEGSSSSVSPTETPTATPKAQSNVQPTTIQPFLSGKYTACDLNKGFINFRQTEPKLDITGKKVVLTMNGAPAKCSIPASNPDLYSCALPVGIKFPAEIIVTMNGTEINKFSIDGTACVITAPPTEDKVEEEPTAEPTIDPND